MLMCWCLGMGLWMLPVPSSTLTLLVGSLKRRQRDGDCLDVPAVFLLTEGLLICCRCAVWRDSLVFDVVHRCWMSVAGRRCCLYSTEAHWTLGTVPVQASTDCTCGPTAEPPSECRQKRHLNTTATCTLALPFSNNSSSIFCNYWVIIGFCIFAMKISYACRTMQMVSQSPKHLWCI